MPVISADANKKKTNSHFGPEPASESKPTTGAEQNPPGVPEESAGIRIILADSQAIYRVGIRKIFAVEDDMRVVAQAENYPGLLAALERFPSDIVLLDGGMISGQAEAIPDLLRRAPTPSSSFRSARIARASSSISIGVAFAASSRVPSRPTS